MNQEIEEHWEVYLTGAGDDGGPMSIVLDLNASPSNYPGLDMVVRMALTLTDVNEHGFPTEKQYEALEIIDETFSDLAEKVSGGKIGCGVSNSLSSIRKGICWCSNIYSTLCRNQSS